MSPGFFVGSGASAAGGLGMIAAPLPEAAPARNLALLGAALEITAFEGMTRRLGAAGRPFTEGAGGTYLRTAKVLTILAAATSAVTASRSRAANAACGAALITASAATRWGIFHAGIASARDPQYTIVPQRKRLADRRP
jgi:hypothetical protein